MLYTQDQSYICGHVAGGRNGIASEKQSQIMARRSDAARFGNFGHIVLNRNLVMITSHLRWPGQTNDRLSPSGSGHPAHRDSITLFPTSSSSESYAGAETWSM